ncbi:MAG: HesA/MoeB/ThiF family protein [Methanomassiliicoccales archaeon]|nr:HesA/MoeB/ThiF family protein [Methanomassiliicoccales archaeon]
MDRERYKCQMLIDGFGEDAQARLSKSTVGVVGLGGLGSAACQYLAVAGVGKIIIADRQSLEVADLGRQVLHWELDVTELRTKVESAAWKLRRLNSRVETVKVLETIDDHNVGLFYDGAEVMLDCTNDDISHAVLNRFCVSKRLPLVFAAVNRFSGMLTTVVPGKSPCLSCLSSELRSGAPSTSVIAAAGGVFGTLQAIEAVKLLTGYGAPLVSRLLSGDTGCNAWNLVEVTRRKDCDVCGRLP